MTELKPTSFKNGVPKGERNAFFGSEERIIAEAGEIIVAVVTYEVAKIVHEEIEDEKYPVVEIKHIEIVRGDKDIAAALKLRDAAYKKRTGENSLDLGDDMGVARAAPPSRSPVMTLAAPDTVAGSFVLDMDEDEYHAHPALSQTGMKALLRSPRHFRAMRSSNRARPEFDVGHAAHAMILGVGAPVVEIPAHLLSVDGGIRTTAAKSFVKDAQEAGQTPLKPPVYTAVRFMAEAVLKHEKARGLLERDGFTEVSLFADDPVTGVSLRGRLDRYADGIPIDVKSTTDVQLRKLTTAIVDFGYDVQAAVYRELLRLVLGVEPEPMHFVFVEKSFPHDVRVLRLADEAWVTGGERRMREAIDLFAWCNERGVWPGPDDDGPIQDLPAPGWYAARYADAVTFEGEPF